MSLKSKVILILLGVSLIYGIANYAIQHFIVFQSFLELERSEAKENVDRAYNAIQREIEHLSVLCHDWSAWDDSYDFVESHSPKYILSNLVNDVFSINNLNLLYIYDSEGQVVWGETRDLVSGAKVHLDKFPPAELPKNHPLNPLSSKSETLADLVVSGIFVTPQELILIASRPIINSNNEGPVKGTFVMGKFLNLKVINALSEQTKVKFQILSTDSPLLSKEIKNLPLWQENSDNLIINEKNDYLLAYSKVPDIMGGTAFFIEVKTPRKISEKGFTVLFYAVVSIVLFNFIMLIAIIFILEYMIFHPLQRLTRHILAIGESTDFSARLSVRRRDEIGTVAKEFDKMLTRIENQTIRLEKFNKLLEEDVTRRKRVEIALQEANYELQRLAALDSLTHLANRRRFDEFLHQEWRRSKQEKQSLSLIMCDVDCFKLYNDTYGHQLGDDCLQAIAQAIKSSINRPSDLAARYGGEEFVVVLPNTSRQSAIQIAEAIRLSVRRLKIVHSASFVDRYVTLSLGVSSLIPSAEFSLQTFVALADVALYEAKKQGRDRLVCKTGNDITFLR